MCSSTPPTPPIRPPGDTNEVARPRSSDNEHRKIETKLDAVERELEAIARASVESTADAQLRCLRLLDRQKVLQDILEHHDLRERRFVYPHLSMVLGPADQREIVDTLMKWPS